MEKKKKKKHISFKKWKNEDTILFTLVKQDTFSFLGHFGVLFIVLKQICITLMT